MYTSISQQYIYPGLKLCEQMSMEAMNPRQGMERGPKVLNKFMKDAQDGVKKTVQAVSAGPESTCSVLRSLFADYLTYNISYRNKMRS
jgi:hypothetical protein